MKSLIRREAPEESLVGIVLAALSLIVMPMLVRMKRRVARELKSGALQAESRQTLICAYLSAILLAGLGLNAWLGWWWADPVAGIAMIPLIVREGLEAAHGETCGDRGLGRSGVAVLLSTSFRIAASSVTHRLNRRRRSSPPSRGRPRPWLSRVARELAAGPVADEVGQLGQQHGGGSGDSATASMSGFGDTSRY